MEAVGGDRSESKEAMSDGEEVTFEMIKLSESRTQYRIIVPRDAWIEAPLPDETLRGEAAKLRICAWMLAYTAGFAMAHGLHDFAAMARALATHVDLHAFENEPTEENRHERTS